MHFSARSHNVITSLSPWWQIGPRSVHMAIAVQVKIQAQFVSKGSRVIVLSVKLRFFRRVKEIINRGLNKRGRSIGIPCREQS